LTSFFAEFSTTPIFFDKKIALIYKVFHIINRVFHNPGGEKLVLADNMTRARRFMYFHQKCIFINKTAPSIRGGVERKYTRKSLFYELNVNKL
jgi:hypothetical protein